MGNKSSSAELYKIKSESEFDYTDYLKMIRYKKRKFYKRITHDHKKRELAHKLSILADVSVLDVNWKDFAEDFLEQHEDACFWANMLKKFIKEMNGDNEKRWIDQIFYLRFANALIPQSINEETEERKKFLYRSVLEDKMINSSIDPTEIMRKKSGTLKINEEYEIKFLHINIDSALRNLENPFNSIIRKFCELLVLKYKEILKQKTQFIENHSISSNKTMPENEQNKNQIIFSKELLVNVQYFIQMLVYGLTLFYKTVIPSDCLFTLREMVVNSCVDIIFTGELYEILYKLIQNEHEIELENLSKKIDENTEKLPINFGVNEYLSLQENIIKSKLSSKTLPEEQKSSEISHSTESEHKGEPYIEAIEKLKEVFMIKTPIKKLTMISDINGTICECVDNYWKNTKIDSEKLSIDADQYLSILLYIIVRAENPNLYIDTILSNELTGIAFRVDYNKYCLTTLLAGFSHLLNPENSQVSQK